jgi:hypothetical protein
MPERGLSTLLDSMISALSLGNPRQRKGRPVRQRAQEWLDSAVASHAPEHADAHLDEPDGTLYAQTPNVGTPSTVRDLLGRMPAQRDRANDAAPNGESPNEVGRVQKSEERVRAQ